MPVQQRRLVGRICGSFWYLEASSTHWYMKVPDGQVVSTGQNMQLFTLYALARLELSTMVTSSRL
jgi:hypothetical protein